MEKKIYQEQTVILVPIEVHENDEKFSLPFNRDPSLVDVLELIAIFSLEDQLYIFSNLLTISGFSEKEISEAMNVPYQKDRTRLMDIRKDFAKKGIKEI